MIKDRLEKYYIRTKKDNTTVFINKQKNIHIEDRGNRIVSKNIATNKATLEETVRLMLDIAEAKGFDLSQLEATGSKEFIEESNRQIAKRLRQKEEKQKEFNKIDERATSLLDTYKMLRDEEKIEKEIDKNSDLTEIKKYLQAKTVLEYAAAKYKIDITKYEVTEDNKINNLSNQQKAKNVIDFLQKEIHLKISEAIDIVRTLYAEQLKNNPIKLNRDSIPIESKRDESMPIKLNRDETPIKLRNFERSLR